MNKKHKSLCFLEIGGWVSQGNYFGNLNESGPLRVFIYTGVILKILSMW